MPARTGTAKRVGSFGVAATEARRSKTKKAAAQARRTNQPGTAGARAIAKTAYNAATHAVMDMKELKYFEVNGDQLGYPQVPTEGNKLCSTIAFATTSNIEAGGVLTEKYCGHDIVNLMMLNSYTATSAVNKRPYALDGKYCVPMRSQTQWQIDRNYIRTGDSNINGGNNIDVPPTADINDPDLYKTLPIRCRIIRVTPKVAPGITTAIDPSNDLFVDQHGDNYSSQKTGFSYSDLEYAEVNRRKYTVIGDTKFTLGQPMTAQWNVFAVLDPGGGQRRDWTQRLVHPKQPPVKRFQLSHQLASKKNGAVYFEDPANAATFNATSGHRREYIFMHFWYECPGGSTTGQGNQKPDLVTANDCPIRGSLSIHYRTRSQFKDV